MSGAWQYQRVKFPGLTTDCTYGEVWALEAGYWLLGTGNCGDGSPEVLAEGGMNRCASLAVALATKSYSDDMPRSIVGPMTMTLEARSSKQKYSTLLQLIV